MAKFRVPLVYVAPNWVVQLPSFEMVPHSVLPIIDGKTTSDGVMPDVDPHDPDLSKLTCLVIVPDLFTYPIAGGLDFDYMRTMHPGFGPMVAANDALAADSE